MPRFVDGWVDVQPWRILVVDDDEDIAKGTAGLVATATPDGTAHTQVETSFEKSLTIMEEGRFDLLVLDVRDQAIAAQSVGAASAELGLRTYEQVRQRRFLPIVFHTALPHLVESLQNPPFVQVVAKLEDDPVAALRDAVRVAFESGLPAINRGLNRHVEEVTRDFMIDFVEQHWDVLGQPVRRGDLAHLLLRRLGVSLAAGGSVLAGALGDGEDFELSPEAVHPMRLYVVPPVGDHVTGDILRGPVADGDPDGADPASLSWWVVLTPACDLVTGRGSVKADFVVLAQCSDIEEFDEVVAWRSALAGADADSTAGEKEVAAKEKIVRRLLQNNTKTRQNDRFHYLPAAWQIPDLIVDLQRVIHVPHASLVRYTRVATLDSPYAEALANRFSRYLGRVGTPDLDLEVTIARLRVPGTITGEDASAQENSSP